MNRNRALFGFGTISLTAFLAGLTFWAVGTPVGHNAHPEEAFAKTQCAATEPSHSREVFIEAGTCTMGADNERQEERHAHRVALSGFWIDAHEVTNKQFKEFVTRQAT